MARSADDDSGVSSERMRQKLMVPFESMSNKSFDQYAQKPHNTRGDGTSGVESILDDVDEDDDFQRYKRSVGGSINLSSPSLRPKGLDRQYNNSGTNSRPSSSSNRLQSLVKPLGANSATDFIDSYY